MSDVQISEIATFQIVSGLYFEHRPEVDAGTQVKGLYEQHAAEINTAIQEYQAAAAKIPPGNPAAVALAQAGVLFEVMRAHPKLAPLVVQALGIIYPHVPQLQKAITETQAKVMTAT